MGIQVEFNPDLALRSIEEFRAGRRKKAECVPENLEKGEVYSFLKKGQRLYWLHGEIPLKITKGNQDMSSPVASVAVLEAVHFVLEGEAWTKGSYRVVDVFDPSDGTVHFNTMDRI